MSCWAHIPADALDSIRAFAALNFADGHKFWQPAGIDRQFLTGSAQDMVLLKMASSLNLVLHACN